jgi:hypothetical protein
LFAKENELSTSPEQYWKFDFALGCSTVNQEIRYSKINQLLPGLDLVRTPYDPVLYKHGKVCDWPYETVKKPFAAVQERLPCDRWTPPLESYSKVLV